MEKVVDTREQTSFILFTDIYRSSSLWERYPDEFARTLEKHNAIVEQAVESRQGAIMKNLGDGYIALFDTPSTCVAAMVDVNKAIGTLPPFPDDTKLRLRVVGHGGMLKRLAVGSGYFGHALNRAARIMQVCNPGQAILSDSVRTHLSEMPRDTSIVDLGLHYLRDLQEPEKLYQLNHPDFPSRDFPPLATLKNRPNNLAFQPNSFIGRESEMHELSQLLLEGYQRLITITAPGGYGKSRLATQLCADLVDCFENGVFEVLLAPVGSHERIVGAAARAFGFQFYGRADPRQQLIGYLREKNMLISFDNFEHVMEGKWLIAEILKHAPKVSILVTSREPLHITGEMVYTLSPLPTGRDDNVGRPPVGRRIQLSEEPGGGAQVPALQQDIPESVQLFLDRAMLVKHDFALTPENVAQVEKLCSRLQGVPLSIELSAGWADSFTLPELLAEVEQQLELTARMEDVPERQRSIRASLDWSYNLLSKEQAGILRAVSTFMGGFFLEAAEAVGRALKSGAGVSPVISPAPTTIRGRDGSATDVVSALQKGLRKTLTQLCDKGWLFMREAAGRTRFFISDAATQQYSLAKLMESADYEAAVFAHAKYYATLLEREGMKLEGRGQLEALGIIASELENIFQGLMTALGRKEADLLLPYAKYLSGYYEMVSNWRDGLARYEQMHDAAKASADRQLLAYVQDGRALFLYHLGKLREAEEIQRDSLNIHRDNGNTRGVAISLGRLGVFAKAQGRYEEADKLHQEALAMFRKIGDRAGIARCLDNLGISAFEQGEYAKAEKLHKESLLIEREIGIPTGVADTLHSLGILAYDQGRYEEAEKILQECLQVQRKIGNRARTAALLNNLANLVRVRGNNAEAEKLYQESLQISRVIGDRIMAAPILNNLGALYAEMGRLGDASACLAEGVRSAKEINSREDIACGTIVAGYLLAKAGKPQQAAVILAGAVRQAKEMNYSFEPMEQGLLHEGGAMYNASLSPEELAGLTAQGEKMSLDELAEYTLKALGEMEKGLGNRD